jgi:hypothetical protein
MVRKIVHRIVAIRLATTNPIASEDFQFGLGRNETSQESRKNGFLKLEVCTPYVRQHFDAENGSPFKTNSGVVRCGAANTLAATSRGLHFSPQSPTP